MLVEEKNQQFHARFIIIPPSIPLSDTTSSFPLDCSKGGDEVLSTTSIPRPHVAGFSFCYPDNLDESLEEPGGHRGLKMELHGYVDLPTPLLLVSSEGVL